MARRVPAARRVSTSRRTSTRPKDKLFYLLTGLSGAGKSLVSHSLEDQGVYCVDNLPVEVLEHFIELTIDSPKGQGRILLVIDVRSGDQFQQLFTVLDKLGHKGIRHSIIFLEASNETLVRRFSETRRRHPLDHGGSLIDAIKRERVMLADLRERADILVDSTGFTSAQLKQHILKVLSKELPRRRMNLVLMSFGFKHGIPVDSDLVIDVRFMPNPYYVADLAALTGCHEQVRRYVFKWDVSRGFMRRLASLLHFLVPQYVREGKSHLTVSVGCTGGQHRSVAVVEKLAILLKRHRVNIIKTHRELERQLAPSSRP